MPALLESAESIYIQFANTPEVPDILQDLLPRHPIDGILLRPATVAVATSAAGHAETLSASQSRVRPVSMAESPEALGAGDVDSLTSYSWISIPTSSVGSMSATEAEK